MSESIRQSNLFAAEDYQKVFKAYQFIDYTAYDFDTLKQALINYIQTYYPEDFNDYIESSEFIAIIELLAYFGTSLAFRTDLNSRENFIDTATRRESIIRLAQMVNYVPRRNIPASGLFKIAAVQTNQPLTDANGININDLTIYWNDPNNPDWFDQFVQICNASFSTLNPFGRPTKSGTIGSIPTDLYQLNNVLRQNVVYATSITVNGQSFPIDVCNPNFITNQSIFERAPNPLNPFNFIYRNDSLGVASNNTGFFLYFKQGNLINIDTNFEFPVPNRLFPITTQNINQDDVYVQETDQNGNVINQWLKVPALAGENIIYNSIQYGERNIFDVISGANDTVTIRFADGNFGNVPTGLFRSWVRVSANQDLVIRPTDAQGLQIIIPYIGNDQQQYNLTVYFNLETTSGNAAASETNDQIKLRAPEVFSTQSRMVNGSDYNVLPLVYGNQIAKISAIDRTYSGQSRYIDLNDPTGFHRDLIIFGQDGALYRDNADVLVQVSRDASNAGNINTILINSIQEMLRDTNVSKFFYDEYITQFEEKIRVNKQVPSDTGYSILDLNNPYQTPLIWRTSPAKFKNTTGYFSDVINGDTSTAQVLVNSLDPLNTASGTYQPWGMITSGSVLEFNVQSASVNSIIQNGLPLIANPLNPYADIGPVELGVDVQTNTAATKLYPEFRNELTTNEINEVIFRINDGISFWLYYDLLTNEWHTSTAATPGIADQSQQPWIYPVPTAGSIYSTWSNHPDSGLLYVTIASNNEIASTTYDLTARGRSYVFESYRDVRFYWEPNQIIIDNASGLALQDTIEVMPFVNTNSLVNNNDPVIPPAPVQPFLQSAVNFTISGVYTQDDGYQDESKVQVSLIDANNDGIPDDPAGFDKVVSEKDRIVFEYYTNEVSGYQSTRPWVANWGLELSTWTDKIYVYIPIYSGALQGSPYLTNTYQPDPLNPVATKIIYMNDTDLVFLPNSIIPGGKTQMEDIAIQLSAFFNDPTMAGIDPSTRTILSTYFFNKSFLKSDTLPGHGVYYALEYTSTADIGTYYTGTIITSVIDTYHYDKNGKVFTQNTSINTDNQLPFYFKWSHYSPIDQRVDPAATNIIDMVVITNSYNTDMINWKNNNGTLITKPTPPTTEDLRIQFQNLDQYKMVSDSMIWNSGEFKILFGPQAVPELQATFKVVKAPSSSISDNEVKTLVIQSIDLFFDIRNWDFGEKFFYTELAAFIHQQLQGYISSVVIVPNNATSQFGDLFEIVAGPTQLFMSTATVNNVQIIANLTTQNMRI
jgi:hypothetical protein